MKLSTVYLICAIVGAIIPMIFFIEFGMAEGINLMTFIKALFVNGAAGGITADLLISSFIFWIYMFSQQRQEQYQKSVPQPWIFIGLNLCIGLSCALPAYLYIRSKNAH